MKIIKVFLTTLITAGFLNSQDLPQVSRKTVSEKDVPQAKPSITSVVNQAQEFILHTIEEGQNIIREIRISNPRRDLTIMVFINGKNDLEAAGLLNVNDMERVGSTDKVNIVVEFGRIKGYTADDGDWVGVRRYYIKKDTDTSKITSPIVYSKTGPNRYDMGDFKKVIEFVKWTKQKFPAKRYMLILWDHGTGWLDPPKREEQRKKGISFDEETGNYITTEEIGNIVKAVGGVDILAFDACLMQMAEVFAEVKDHTKIIIGSEEVVPGYGYPYALFLDPIVKNPNMSNEDIGRTVVKAFEMFYNYVKIPASLSASRANKIDGLFERMKNFAKAAMESDEIDALKKAREDVIRFDILGEQDDPYKTVSFFADIYDFARIVSENIKKDDEKSKALKNKAAELMDYIEKELVIANGYYGNERSGKPLSLGKGISAYFPPAYTRITYDRIDSILRTPYSSFKLAKLTEWDKFVQFLYEKAK